MNRRIWRQLVVCACIAGASTLHAAVASAAPLAPTTLPAPLGSEAEPDDSPALASPIIGDQRIRASLSPVGDVDFFRFEASEGDRVFANVVTAGSQSTAADTRLMLLNSDGVTQIEEDDNDGSQYALGSSIAGARIPAAGVYYLRIEDTRGALANPAAYDLYFALRGGLAISETEPNDKPTEANMLVNGEMTGVHTPADEDYFSINLQAGDTVFLSVDLDPDRSGETFTGRLGFGPTGDTNKTPRILVVPSPGEVQDVTSATTSPSDAMTMTVSKSGSYYVRVDSDQVTSGGPEATYDLAATVFPAAQPSCRTYSSPITGALLDGGTRSFPIQVEDPATVSRVALRLGLEESVMRDLDVSLRNPSGLELPIFADSVENVAGAQQQLEAVFDDFAAVPPLYPVLRPLGLRPKIPLASFSGQQAQGTWLLTIADDTVNESGGNLSTAELILCGDPSSGSPPGSGNPAAARPQTKPAQPPVLSGFTISPGQFRAAKVGPMVSAKRPKAGGALVGYQSSEPVQTNLVLFELEQGRKVGKKCVKPTASNATKKPCVRPVKVISFVRNDVAGRNQFGFTGRVGARKLPPGEYQLQARAYAASGLTSAPVSATFTVLAPTAKESRLQRK